MDDCIEHKGYKDSYGYGIRQNKGKKYKAHRIAYCDSKNIDINDIDGLVVMHLCDNPLCINPEHLKVGTHQDNMDDMVSKNRQPKGCYKVNAKLTEKDVLEIIRLSKFNTQKTLAEIFKVSQTHISRIVRGKKWKYLSNKA